MAVKLAGASRLALALGGVIGLSLAVPAAIFGGPLVGLGAFAGAFALSVANLGLVTLLYATIMTRAGARAPEGVMANEHALSLDLGGEPADAWLRLREAALALPGAKVLTEDVADGRLELETRIGPWVQHIHLRLEGTRLSAISRHQPGRKLFDYGAAGKQLVDLRAALERPLPRETIEAEAPRPVPGRELEG